MYVPYVMFYSRHHQNKSIMKKSSLINLLLATGITAIYVECKHARRPVVKLQEGIVEFSNVYNDTCIESLPGMDSLKIYREIEISENTLSDTISIGYGVIRPGQKGKFISHQLFKGNESGVYDNPLDPVNINNPASYAKVMCASALFGKKWLYGVILNYGCGF
jgi:hypothetical protein